MGWQWIIIALNPTVVAGSPPCCGEVSGPRHVPRPKVSTTLLWRGLRTPPRSATEGLRSCTGVETFGHSRWPGLETGPQQGGFASPQCKQGIALPLLALRAGAMDHHCV